VNEKGRVIGYKPVALPANRLVLFY